MPFNPVEEAAFMARWMSDWHEYVDFRSMDSIICSVVMCITHVSMPISGKNMRFKWIEAA